MKVNGKSLTGPRIVSLVLPFTNAEGEEDFIEFKFRALTTKDDFELVQPRPKPPKRILPGGQETYVYDDPKYRESVTAWGNNKINWEFLQSIKVTEGLEWATVQMDDPTTWGNWKADLENYFGMTEHNRIFGGFLDANSLDEEKIDEARKRFLALRAQKT